jgi:hypothetical protein
MNPAERLVPAPPTSTVTVQQIEVNFEMPVTLTKDQHHRLYALMDEIVNSQWNQPTNGVHWLSFEGGRLNFSRRDAAFLGKAPGPDPVPNDGEEPTCDDDVLVLSSTARGFLNADEQERVRLERACLGYCIVCHEPQFHSPAGITCPNGHGGAESLRRRPKVT